MTQGFSSDSLPAQIDAGNYEHHPAVVRMFATEERRQARRRRFRQPETDEGGELDERQPSSRRNGRGTG